MNHTRFMGIFGTCTGASGLLLLRIVDPEFKSPAVQELGLMNAFTLLLIPTTLIIYPLPKVGLLPALLVSVGIIVVVGPNFLMIRYFVMEVSEFDVQSYKLQIWAISEFAGTLYRHRSQQH